MDALELASVMLRSIVLLSFARLNVEAYTVEPAQDSAVPCVYVLGICCADCFQTIRDGMFAFGCDVAERESMDGQPMLAITFSPSGDLVEVK